MVKRKNPCDVDYKTERHYHTRWFIDKVDASKWILKRMKMKKPFEFISMRGSTWKVSDMNLIEEWAAAG